MSRTDFTPLGHFEIGAVFARSFRILRLEAPALILLVLVFNLGPLVLIHRAVIEVPALMEPGSPWIVVAALAPLILAAAGAGAKTSLALDRLEGRDRSLSRSLAGAARTLLVSAPIGLCVNAPQVAGALMTERSDVATRWLLFLAAVVLSLVWGAFLSATLPAALAERRGLIGSLVRAFQLSRGSRLKLFAIALIYTIAWLAAVEVVPTFAYPFIARSYAYAVYFADAALVLMFAPLAAVTYRELERIRDGWPTHEAASVFD